MEFEITDIIKKLKFVNFPQQDGIWNYGHY